MCAALARSGPVDHAFGGRLCLDFVNTVDAWSRPATREDLPDYEALLGWCWQMKALPDSATKALRQQAAAHPRSAAAAHAKAMALRASLHRLFTAAIDRKRPATADLDLLNALAAAARSRQRLVPGASWSLTLVCEGDLASPLFAVTLSAQALLVSAELDRIKRCPGPVGCGWLFFDQSKNRTRRWCSMEHCGTRAKSHKGTHGQASA